MLRPHQGHPHIPSPGKASFVWSTPGTRFSSALCWAAPSMEDDVADYTAKRTDHGTVRVFFKDICIITISNGICGYDNKGKPKFGWRAFPLSSSHKPSRKGWSTPLDAARRFGTQVTEAVRGAVQ